MAFCRTKICPTRNAGNWDADVVEVGRTVLTDTVKRRDCYFELYSLWHSDPTKHVAKSRCDVFVSANVINDITNSPASLVRTLIAAVVGPSP